jgi:acetyl-CoA carboxylase biotin carboxyl carrier protein
MTSSDSDAAPGLNVSIVAALAEIAVRHDLSEVEVDHNGLKIRVARERHPAPVIHAVAAAPVAVAPAAVVTPAAAPSAPEGHPGAVKSPMVGTAYLRPSPESKPFVEIGAMVKVGDKLMLVEAMKTYNEIVAPRAGKVTAILVQEGSPVEYDQPLMVIE